MYLRKMYVSQGNIFHLVEADVLNMNFSVGVSMYSENVTSYW